MKISGHVELPPQRKRMGEGVTQIINQNNINNFIINNPQRVEVIEISPAKAQIVPQLKTSALMRFPTPERSAVKKLVAAKKLAQPRPVSAAARRSSPPKAKQNEKDKRERPKTHLREKRYPSVKETT